MPLSNEAYFASKNPEKYPYGNVWIQDYTKVNLTIMISEGIIIESEEEYNLYFTGSVPGVQGSVQGMLGKLAIHRKTYERKDGDSKKKVEPTEVEKRLCEQIEANKELLIPSEPTKGISGRLCLFGEAFDSGKHLSFSKFEVASCDLTSLPPIPEKSERSGSNGSKGGGNTYINYESEKDKLDARVEFLFAQLGGYAPAEKNLFALFITRASLKPEEVAVIDMTLEAAFLLMDINPSSLMARALGTSKPSF